MWVSLRKYGIFKGVSNGKIEFLKNWRPIRGPMSFAAKGKKANAKWDKHHTVLQKLLQNRHRSRIFS